MVEKLQMLLDTINDSGVTGYMQHENTIADVLNGAFAPDSSFIEKMKKIKSGWGVESAISHMYGQVSDATYNRDKFRAYTELLQEAINYLKTYSNSIEEAVQMDNKRVFIVHGHDEKLKFED